MSFSVDGSSREAIQAIQFELWPDCKTGCKFCYLNGTRRITTFEEKSNNLKNTLETLKNEEIIKNYNAIGLIGGDFFQGQISEVEKDWYDLIEYINTLLINKKIKEVWIASSLINIMLGDIHGTLNRFDYDKLSEDQRIIICTSYDTVGRFLSDINVEDVGEDNLPSILRLLHLKDIVEFKDYLNLNQPGVNSWLETINTLLCTYPRIKVHIEVILTQDLINRFIANPNYFDFLTNLGCIVDFRYPSITRADCPAATGIKNYREVLLQKRDTFPENFFIENRSSFLHFLKLFKDKYGLQKVQDLIHQPEMRSRRLVIYIDDVEIEDRWNDNRDVYLECGHLVDGLCYIDDEKHCIYCDIEKFIKSGEDN